MHLAQLNVARMVAPLDDPVMADFKNALGPINELAESTPGFVWRLKGSEDDPTALVDHDYGDFAVTYSVWESRQALWDFIYRTAHLPYLRRRREWFHHTTLPSAVLWWVEEGEIPSLKHGLERLEHLREHGPTPHAFTFKDFYETTTIPRHISSWVPSPQTT